MNNPFDCSSTFLSRCQPQNKWHHCCLAFPVNFLRIADTGGICTVIFALVVCMHGLADIANAQVLGSSEKPPVLEGISIEQKLDEQIPLDLTFTNELGETVALRDYFGEKPVILSLVYYECPMLCTMILNGLLESMVALKFDAGHEFQVVTLSFDDRETAEIAAKKKKSYLARYSRDDAESGWHFLTGEKEQIKQLAESVGFAYKFVPETGQYVHASAIMVLTPEGRLSRYFYGIEYDPNDLRLALVEASESKIGSPVDQLLLYCFHYDPTTGKYGLVIMNVIRLVGTAVVLLLVGFIIVMLRREKRAKNGFAKV